MGSIFNDEDFLRICTEEARALAVAPNKKMETNMALLVSDEEVTAIREAHMTGEATRAHCGALLNRIDQDADRIEKLLDVENQTIGHHVELSGATAASKGWHMLNKSVGEDIALMHSELSEALEAFRDGLNVDKVYVAVPNPAGGVSQPTRLVPYDPDNPLHAKLKPEGVPIELADVLIRVFDFCYRHGIDMTTALRLKHAYNATRPHLHGGKKL